MRLKKRLVYHLTNLGQVYPNLRLPSSVDGPSTRKLQPITVILWNKLIENAIFKVDFQQMKLYIGHDRDAESASSIKVVASLWSFFLFERPPKRYTLPNIISVVGGLMFYLEWFFWIFFDSKFYFFVSRLTRWWWWGSFRSNDFSRFVFKNSYNKNS